jgi:hypothetical protein
MRRIDSSRSQSVAYGYRPPSVTDFLTVTKLRRRFIATIVIDEKNAD